MKLLLKKCLFTLLILTIYELGSLLILPGFPSKDYISIIGQNAYINFVSSNFGTRITIPGIFALGMGPYMTALIVWQTITVMYEDTFKKLSQRTVGIWQKFITLVLSILQSIATAVLFMNYKPQLNGASKTSFCIMTIVILTGGAMFIVWLADLNARSGIGGTSILIIPGLLKNLPSVLNSGLKNPIDMNFTAIVLLVLIVIVFSLMSVYINQAEIRIKVERVSVNNNLTGSYLPIKLLASGAMPFMFALSLYSIPLMVLPKIKLNNSTYNFISNTFSFHTFRGILLYGIVIIILGYGFAFVNVRPHTIARNLQKNGDYLLNVIPGSSTEKYITNKLYIAIFISNIYIVFIALLPLFIGMYVPQITNFSFLFGSLLILITMLDNLRQEIFTLFSKKQYNMF